jgi:hypothetical protein
MGNQSSCGKRKRQEASEQEARGKREEARKQENTRGDESK